MKRLTVGRSRSNEVSGRPPCDDRTRARRVSVAVRGIASLLAVNCALPVHGQIATGSMDVKWREEARDCQKDPQPPLQVHRYNAQTFILR